METGRCITVPVAELQFIDSGNTIWVHGPQGATVLRIKTPKGQITVNRECENLCSHCDLIVDGDIEFCCVPADLVPSKQGFAQGCLFALALLAAATLGILAVSVLQGP